MLAWPDILVGPGLSEGSTVLCYEQVILDVEVFRHCRRLHIGIGTNHDEWLEDVIARVGPGVNEILAGPLIDPLPDSVEEQLDSLLRRADRELSELQ